MLYSALEIQSHKSLMYVSHLKRLLSHLMACYIFTHHCRGRVHETQRLDRFVRSHVHGTETESLLLTIDADVLEVMVLPNGQISDDLHRHRMESASGLAPFTHLTVDAVVTLLRRMFMDPRLYCKQWNDLYVTDRQQLLSAPTRAGAVWQQATIATVIEQAEAVFAHAAKGIRISVDDGEIHIYTADAQHSVVFKQGKAHPLNISL